MLTSKKSKPRAAQVASRKVRKHQVSLADYLPGLLNHDGSEVDECVVVVNSVTAQEKACCSAHTHVEKTSPNAERAKAAYVEDLDVLANAKMIEAIHRAFRTPDDDTYSLFITPDWMRDGLTGIAVGILANIYAECQKAEEPGAFDEITSDKVDDVLRLCVDHFDDDVPELVLAQHGREWLSQFVIMAAHYLDDERRKAAALVEVAAQLIQRDDDGTSGAELWHSNAEAYLDNLPGHLLAVGPEDDGNTDADD